MITPPIRPCYSHLEDRSVLRVQGKDTVSFLQRLITNDIRYVNKDTTIYALLLTPQGKFLYDFFILNRSDNDVLIECYRPLHDALMRHLLLYKLRADIMVTAETDYRVYALQSQDFSQLNHGETIHLPEGYIFVDPRHIAMGQRAVLTSDILSENYGLSACSGEWYHNQRFDLTLPQGHDDLVSGVSYPHDFNMDHFNAIDYQKGCYVGQEVTARMHYKAKPQKAPYTVRAFNHMVLPPQGTPITQASAVAGIMCSSVGKRGLAVIKKEAVDKALHAGNTPISVDY